MFPLSKNRNLISFFCFSLQAIATKLHFPIGSVKHVTFDGDTGSVLNAADIVVYGSFHEEQSFPEILMKAMCIGKLIIAPDLSMIRKFVCFYSYDTFCGYPIRCGMSTMSLNVVVPLGLVEKVGLENIIILIQPKKKGL